MFPSVKKYFYTNTSDGITIRTIFKPIYLVLSIFGLFPYSVKFDKKHGLTIIKKSIYINALCAVSYVLFMSALLALHIRYVYDSLGNTSMTREVMTQLNYVLELVVSFLFCVSAYICAFNNRCTFVNIINDIADMVGPPNVDTDGVLKALHIKIKVKVMGSLIFVLLLQICVNFTRDDSFWKMVLVFVTFILPQMIQFTVLAFYYFLILILAVLLVNIRAQISGITKHKASLMEYGLQLDAKILTLQYLEGLYMRACEIKRDINKSFEALMLVTTIQSFHSMVSEAHIIYHGSVIESDFTLHALINCSIWIIYQVFKVFLLARTGTLLKKEIMKIGETLHKIPIEKQDIRLFLEIQHFSSLMSNQDNEITAYGLFTVDATLLSKVISSSAMYMIILMQFDRK